MEFSQTSLGEEFRLIQEYGYDSYARYDAAFITDEGEYPVLTVVSLESIRDYRNASADEMFATVVIEWGKYLTKVLPFKENLKLVITKRPISRKGLEIVDKIVEQTFIVHLPEENENDSIAGRPETSSQSTADLVGLKNVSVQLEEEAYSRVRSELVGGSFRDSRPFDVLMGLLHTSNINLDLDVESSIKGISATPPNNNSKRNHILIPQGTPLVSVAGKLQQQFGGVYNCGIGCYLQKGYWYVWPLYNYKLHDQATHKALFIIAPTTRYRGIETTYRKNGNDFIAVVTGGFNRIDPSEGKLLNAGSGTRFSNTDNMLEGFVNVKDNKATARRDLNANEYEAVARKGKTMARVTDDMSQSNPFNEASKLAERNAAYFMLNWENSDPDLIFPGLQVEVGFVANNRERFINGVVVHSHAYSAMSGTGLHQKNHQTTTEVVVMVDRLAPAYKEFLDSQ
ncbi:hypothetical protein D3C85_14980 [compost metagenome]